MHGVDGVSGQWLIYYQYMVYGDVGIQVSSIQTVPQKPGRVASCRRRHLCEVYAVALGTGNKKFHNYYKCVDTWRTSECTSYV